MSDDTLLDTLKTAFLNGKFNPMIDTIGAFLSKIRTLFSILKKGKGGLPLHPSCAPVIVAKYVLMSLNMSKCP